MMVKKWIATRMRQAADKLDPKRVPATVTMNITFNPGKLQIGQPGQILTSGGWCTPTSTHYPTTGATISTASTTWDV